jgi:hypothetical protein
MTKTDFENLKRLLKAHPEVQPIARPHRAANKRDEESPTRPPAFDRHRRKCLICRHPDRQEIERDFLRWRSTREIAQDFGLADHSSICRHTHATGLTQQRERRVAYALHPILEQGEDVFLKLTPNAIISAVRTYSQINDHGGKLRSKPVTNVYYVAQNDPATK